MSTTRSVVRAVVVVTVGAAAGFAATGLGVAAPIDIQPTPMLCPAGIGAAESQVATDNATLGGEQVFYFLRDPNGKGAHVAYLNLATGVAGSQAFANAPAGTPWIGTLPIALAETGAGPVVSAVYGMHTNTAGEACILLPGLDLSQVPPLENPENDG
ncbi:hypothetical protein JWS13_04530 (plasmid) [Rhodococcus pseudokoreensis]|uniref:MPT63-like domain-containing protein n=1 Tax=Rhodococcus pseudokoreensis TaxID=2811421 RepID=A0A974VZ41_9NOCA|nr:hypothetical protein [Rhodococcus pseudokoreensis]QSE87886.1 hypothetical protein JWS13_04530 [Rhodococcus pseudokoreensis]